MANLDLELRKLEVGGTGVVVLALPAFLSSVISSSCNQNKGGREGSPSPSPRSTTAVGGKMQLISKKTPNPPCAKAYLNKFSLIVELQRVDT